MTEKLSTIRLPTPQAQNCATFTPPLSLLGRSNTTVPELYEWNAAHNSDHSLFLFDDKGITRTISWKEANQGVHRAARFFTRYVPVHYEAIGVPPVVAILAASDTITFATSIIGLLRAGFTVFLISPRNSSDAIAHLLSQTGARHLFTSLDASIKGLTAAVLELIQADSVTSPLDVHPMPLFDDLYPYQPDIPFEPFPLNIRSAEAPAIILHSSGSTSFPKPISCDHRFTMHWSRIPWFGSCDLAGVVLGCHSVAMFHGFGLIQVFYAATCGAILATFRPQSPAIIPSPNAVFDGIVATKSDVAFGVPSFIEQWSADPNKVAYMTKMLGVLYGGAPLSKVVGDALVSKGVRLRQALGSSEGGVISLIFPEYLGSDWEYVRISEQVNHEFVPRGDGVYELILLADKRWAPNVLNTKMGEYEAYATNDLFVRHPSKPGLWKIQGRADDQLMLSTGEKTNPGPLERILLQDPRIRGAVMFGRGRFQNGILVDPESEVSFDPKDNNKLEGFRNAIWPTIEKMNKFAPQHSRIFKEMILVSSPSKPWAYSLKAIPRRQAVIDQYEPEIEAVYKQVEDVPTVKIHQVRDWIQEDSLKYVRGLVHDVMKHKIGDNEDLFQSGCDSLQATWIRIRIQRTLRELGPDAMAYLGHNFVFEAPSITRLADLLFRAIHSSSVPALEERSNEKEMFHLLEKYTSNLPTRPHDMMEDERSGDVILLTGTTGGFGCNILAHLSLDTSVKKVYALNRHSASDGVIQRQIATMNKLGLLEDCLHCPKFHLLEGDLSQPTLGLEPGVLEIIRNAVTHIIHNAWPVDFNLTLSSFESSLQGLRNLVELALASPYKTPPSVCFISSIGIFRDPSQGPATEEHVSDVGPVIRSGYSAAKWIGERILHKAAEETGLRTTVVRVGQLCGNRNGYWNEKEWFPSIIKSALTVRCLPDVQGEGPVSWIPSYEAAAALVQMIHSEEPVLHLASAHPVPLHTFMKPFSEALDVPLVPYPIWLKAMEDNFKDARYSEVELVEHNPGLRLLSFYRNAKFDGKGEPPGVVQLDTSKARKVATSLNQVKLGAEWVDKWIQAWRRTGFLPQSDNARRFEGKYAGKL